MLVALVLGQARRRVVVERVLVAEEQERPAAAAEAHDVAVFRDPPCAQTKTLAGEGEALEALPGHLLADALRLQGQAEVLPGPGRHVQRSGDAHAAGLAGLVQGLLEGLPAAGLDLGGHPRRRSLQARGQVPGGHRLGVSGLGEKEAAGHRPQGAQDALRLVVLVDADDEDPVGAGAAEVAGQGGGGGGVVGAVEQHAGMLPGLLEAARPLVGGQDLPGALRFEVGTDPGGRGHGETGVLHPGRRARRRGLGSRQVGDGLALPLEAQTLGAAEDEGNALLPRPAADEVQDPGVLRGRGEQRPPRPRHGQLLAGDGEQVVAEDGAVVEGDRGQDGGGVIPGVGGVVTAAEADLEDGHLHPLGGEEVGGQHGERLEAREPAESLALEPAGSVVDEGDAVGPGVLVEDAAVDLDALALAVEMGRGVEPGAAAGGLQQRRQQAGHRALAVGAGDDDAAEALLRIPAAPQQGAHPGQVVLEGPLRRPSPLPVREGVEKPLSPGVVHESEDPQPPRVCISR